MPMSRLRNLRINIKVKSRNKSITENPSERTTTRTLNRAITQSVFLRFLMKKRRNWPKNWKKVGIITTTRIKSWKQSRSTQRRSNWMAASPSTTQTVQFASESWKTGFRRYLIARKPYNWTRITSRPSSSSGSRRLRSSEKPISMIESPFAK